MIILTSRLMVELPPRTRRIPDSEFCRVFEGGTTSAHAENTRALIGGAPHIRNYLRARGEYTGKIDYGSGSVELPPRTRRIPSCKSSGRPNSGTTSAHAENTQTINRVGQMVKNYLRARGEYYQAAVRSSCCSELPPRTRRIPAEVEGENAALGTTSAHAENTVGFQEAAEKIGNYLRARGEYAAGYPNGWKRKELPPRTRRIPVRNRGHLPQHGTTSAHAENTCVAACIANNPRNYLRARGEYFRTSFRVFCTVEL